MKLFILFLMPFSLLAQTRMDKINLINSIDPFWKQRAFMRKCNLEMGDDLSNPVNLECVYSEALRVKTALDAKKSKYLMKKQARESLDCSQLTGQTKSMCIILK